MKKLLIASVMALGLSFVSCTSSTNTSNCSCDSTCTCDSACNCNATDTLAVDTVTVDTVQ